MEVYDFTKGSNSLSYFWPKFTSILSSKYQFSNYSDHIKMDIQKTNDLFDIYISILKNIKTLSSKKLKTKTKVFF